jgi:hypothetical protein
MKKRSTVAEHIRKEARLSLSMFRAVGKDIILLTVAVKVDAKQDFIIN